MKPSELEVSYPNIGSCYSLDWLLPVTFVQLVRDAEAMREKLLLHRKCQMAGTKEEPYSKVHALFRGFAENLRTNYAAGRHDNFEVSLLTYDDQECKLVVVDGLRNGAAPRAADWEFTMPFGLGLAGACFREGNQAMQWIRKRLDTRVTYYLPIAGRHEHQAMLLIPIDHPALPLASDLPAKEENSGGFSQRAQQVIALLVIASGAADSRLLDLSTEVQTGKDESIRNEINKLSSIVSDANQLGSDLAKAFGLWQ
jgi:hypothetical protein